MSSAFYRNERCCRSGHRGAAGVLRCGGSAVAPERAGFFQYLAPSAVFLLAVFVYDEPFRTSQLVTFGCIWLALLIFSSEALYYQGRLSQRLAGPLRRERAA